MKRDIVKINASGQTIGRLATKIATILRGKHKADFEPRLNMGDRVEVANIKEVKFTGKKMEQKVYHSYSGYPGGLKTRKMKDIFTADPGEVLRRAVREMLPPVRFRGEMMKRLRVK
jgi:large subunit ribosomal protein L13